MYRVELYGQWYVSLDGEHFLPVVRQPEGGEIDAVRRIFVQHGYNEQGRPEAVKRGADGLAMCWNANWFTSRNCTIEQIGAFV